VARDRQRAKQRKARRAAQNPGPAPSQPHRDNVPGPLDHASGEVDEFEAALVAGAEGEPVDEDAPAEDDDERTPAGEERDADADADAEDARRRPEPLAGPEPLAEEDEEDVDDAEPDFDEEYEDDEDEAAAAGGSRSPATRHADAPARPRGPARFLAFLRASWAELQRVQWPDRRQVAQATAVVLGFVVVAGVYLGVADRIAQEVVDLII
jgi:preprotein translocase subunit SecE